MKLFSGIFINEFGQYGNDRCKKIQRFLQESKSPKKKKVGKSESLINQEARPDEEKSQNIDQNEERLEVLEEIKLEEAIDSISLPQNDFVILNSNETDDLMDESRENVEEACAEANDDIITSTEVFSDLANETINENPEKIKLPFHFIMIF